MIAINMPKTNIADKQIIDTDQTTPNWAGLVWIHTFCQKSLNLCAMIAINMPKMKIADNIIFTFILSEVVND